jgi:hypothetical protein
VPDVPDEPDVPDRPDEPAEPLLPELLKLPLIISCIKLFSFLPTYCQAITLGPPVEALFT